MKLRGRPPIDECQEATKKPVMSHEDNVSKDKNHLEPQQRNLEIATLHTNLTDEQLQDITLQKGGRLVWKSPVILMQRVNLHPTTNSESDLGQVKLTSCNGKDFTNITNQSCTKDEPRLTPNVDDGSASVSTCPENDDQNSQTDKYIAMETECLQNTGPAAVVSSNLLHQDDTCITSAQDSLSDAKPTPCMIKNCVAGGESLLLRTPVPKDSSKVVVVQFGKNMIDCHPDDPSKIALMSSDRSSDQSEKIKPSTPELPTLLLVPGRSETCDGFSAGKDFSYQFTVISTDRVI